MVVGKLNFHSDGEEVHIIQTYLGSLYCTARVNEAVTL